MDVFNQISHLAWPEILNRLWQFFLVTVIFWLGRGLVNRFFESRLRHKVFQVAPKTSPQRLQTIWTITKNAINYAFYFFYVYAVLGILGFPVSTLVAGAGIAGVAVGLGVKDFITDVVNGFFIILEGQYEVGEEVKIGDIRGKVQTVGIRTTIIQGTSGNRYYIPNGDISIVNNLSRENRQIVIDLPITDQTQLEDLAHQVQVITEGLSQDYAEDLTAEPVITGVVNDTTTGKFHYEISFYVTNGAQGRLTGAFYFHYLTQLQKAGIHLLD